MLQNAAPAAASAPPHDAPRLSSSDRLAHAEQALWDAEFRVLRHLDEIRHALGLMGGRRRRLLALLTQGTLTALYLGLAAQAELPRAIADYRTALRRYIRVLKESRI